METPQQNDTTVTRGSGPPGSSIPGWSASVLPYIAVGLASSLLLLAYYKRAHQSVTDPIFWLIIISFIVTGLVVVRQILALNRNSKLPAERATPANEARLMSLIELSPDMITVIEANGKILYESPALERVFGYSIPELLGKSLVDFIHPDNRTETVELVARLCSQSRMCERLEMRLLHKDGHFVDIEAVMTNLLDDPNIRGIVINSRSIADRKQAEEVLHEIEEQLRQSQKMEAVGKVAAKAAHDFNNRLAVIIGYSDMLLGRAAFGLTDNARRKVEQIKTAGHEAAGLARDLQALSRGAQGAADSGAAPPAAADYVAVHESAPAAADYVVVDAAAPAAADYQVVETMLLIKDQVLEPQIAN